MEKLMDHSQLGNLVLSIGIIIFVAHIFTAMFKKTKIPDVLLLILIGILIGPSFLNILKPQDFGFAGPILSSIALILMLFEGGNHLSINNLKESLKDSIPIALITFIITFTITTILVFIFITQDIFTSIYAGAVLGSISPAVVVPFINLLEISQKTKSLLFVESAITDVLSIVLALTFLDAFISGHLTVLGFVGELLTALVMATLLGLGGAILWSIVLEKIRQFPNTMFTTLAFLFIIYGLADSMGYSGPITVLVFGILLANAKKIPIAIVKKFSSNELAEFSAFEKEFFSEIIFLVKTFFFIYLGLSIQFGNFFILVGGIIITLGIYAFRFLIVKFILPKTESVREAVLISSIIPKGLAAAVLAELPLFKFTEGDLLYDGFIKVRAVAYSVIFFSIILTAIMVYLTEKDLLSLPIRKFFGKFK